MSDKVAAIYLNSARQNQAMKFLLILLKTESFATFNLSDFILGKRHFHL